MFDTGRARILIDASPDLRQQALQHDIHTIDALILTHAHADHCHGIDDVRSFNFHKNSAIELYADQQTWQEVTSRFSYIFTEHNPKYGWYKPQFTTHIIDAGIQQRSIAGESVTFFPQEHGRVQTLGVRIGNIAYSTDVKYLPEQAFEALEGVDTWIVDCLRYTEAPTHAHLELTLSWIERVQPKRAVLTHLSHEIEYDSLSKRLPAHISVAYDGMVIEA
ncbi:MAG: MBL fold metallo-hydrolase [Sphaerospermopsis sp. SIO1G2]|nr:MBL fold metallo-hydrolase [Sphaerospermopsis sp. SIO1G2]